MKCARCYLQCSTLRFYPGPPPALAPYEIRTSLQRQVEVAARAAVEVAAANLSARQSCLLSSGLECFTCAVSVLCLPSDSFVRQAVSAVYRMGVDSDTVRCGMELSSRTRLLSSFLENNPTYETTLNGCRIVSCRTWFQGLREGYFSGHYVYTTR